VNAPANMNGRFKGHVLFVRMAYDPKTKDEVTEAAEAACFELSAAGYLVTPTRKKGTADIGDNRNVVASQFYVRTEYTHLVMYDQDVSWEPGAILRLVVHPVDLVLGVYKKRIEPEGWPIRTLPGPVECVNPQTGKYHPDGIIKIAGGPGGLMRLSRSCIEKMVSAHADEWYASKLVPGGKVWDLFRFERLDHERISEDMNFCRLWRALGGDVWADPHLRLHHWGDKAFSGCLAAHLREIGRMIEPEKIAKIALDAEPGLNH